MFLIKTAANIGAAAKAKAESHLGKRPVKTFAPHLNFN